MRARTLTQLGHGTDVISYLEQHLPEDASGNAKAIALAPGIVSNVCRSHDISAGDDVKILHRLNTHGTHPFRASVSPMVKGFTLAAKLFIKR